MTIRADNVILNSFQDPGAVQCLTDTVSVATERAWILKQVQDDDGAWGLAPC